MIDMTDKLWNKKRRFHSIILLLCLSWAFIDNSQSGEEGNIRDISAQKAISEKSLIQRLRQADYILLGMDFDNSLHHRQAAEIIEQLSRSGHPPAILTGYIEHHKQNAFAIFRQRHGKTDKSYDATGLDMLLGDSIGNWTMARPVFDMAMLHNLPLKAVGLSRYEIGQLHRGEELPENMKEALAPLLSVHQTASARAKLRRNIAKGFCGKIPPEILEKFTDIHRIQSGLYALSLAASQEKTTLLLAPVNQVAIDSNLQAMLKKTAEDKKISRLVFARRKPNSITSGTDFIWVTDGYADPCKRPQPN